MARSTARSIHKSTLHCRLQTLRYTICLYLSGCKTPCLRFWHWCNGRRLQSAATGFWQLHVAAALKLSTDLEFEQLIGRKRSSLLPSTYPLHDPPNVFNDYFLQKLRSIRVDLDQQSLSLMSCRLTDQKAASNFYSFHPITEAELKATILKPKPTSCSLDPLPTLLLECIDDLLPTLRNIINFSLSSGTFPSTFRSAVVKPLPKKASLDSNNLKNFRPVSNLSFMSKVTEKVVLRQLLAYFTEHKLICPSLSAYCPQHSTETRPSQNNKWHPPCTWLRQCFSSDTVGSFRCLWHDWPLHTS